MPIVMNAPLKNQNVPACLEDFWSSQILRRNLPFWKKYFNDFVTIRRSESLFFHVLAMVFEDTKIWGGASF